MSLLATVVDFVINIYAVFFRNMRTDKMMIGQVLLLLDSQDALVGFVWTAERKGDWLNLERR